MKITKIEILVFDMSKEEDIESYYDRLPLMIDNDYKVFVQPVPLSNKEIQVTFRKEVGK